MAFGDLTTLADVKTWLQTGQSAFPTTDDALLTLLITATSKFITTCLNRQIAEADYFELRDGTGGKRLQVGNFPVCAVLSLRIDGQIIPAAVSSWAAGYTFSHTQLALRGYTFTRRAQNVMVTYTAAFATTPPEIAQACIELVGLRYRERTRIGEVSKALGGGETVSYSQKDVSDAIKTAIQQYRMMAPVAGHITTLSSTQTDPATLA